MNDTLPAEAITLILEAEGIDQPSRWPGDQSGITIGRGYDLAHEKFLERDWAQYLSAAQLTRLKTALGKSGSAARAIAPQFADIKISRLAADAVFMERTLPQEIETTRRAFPGYDDLPPLCAGALVSLVFNRGASVAGDRRREMLNVREFIKAGRLDKVPAEFRSMKRLWAGQGLNGLLKRREAEAKMWERGLTPL